MKVKFKYTQGIIQGFSRFGFDELEVLIDDVSFKDTIALAPGIEGNNKRRMLLFGMSLERLGRMIQRQSKAVQPDNKKIRDVLHKKYKEKDSGVQ